MQSFNGLFPLQNSWLLIISIILGITSIILSAYNKDKAALACLFITAFVLRMFMAHLDPFLHDWDERFHALVARNMMDNPFKPMIRTQTLFPYDYTAWCCNTVWLHKQPLFMWQMALSMKIFGVSEYAIRYPAVLMGALMVLAVHRIAFLATANKKIAFIAAILMCFSYVNLEQISGSYAMELNEITFDFYIIASIWAYAEYRNKITIKWAIILGILAGCAVLNKWLTGLLVFAGWAINILFSIRKKETRQEIIHLIVAIIVCAITFLPWQLYILHAFPLEAKYEFAYNSKHFWEVVESKTGDMWYYFDHFDEYFGRYLWFLILCGILFAILIKKYHNKLVTALVVNLILVYIFFSFLAQTKMLNYFMMAVPIGYIFMAIGSYHILNMKISGKRYFEPVSNILTHIILDFRNNTSKFFKYAFVPTLITISLVIFNLPEITERHDPKNANGWDAKTNNTVIYRSLKQTIPKNINIVFNMNTFEDVELMFYNKNIIAYAWVPHEEDFNKFIKANNIPIAVFKAHNEYGIPDYIKNYPLTYIIDKDLK